MARNRVKEEHTVKAEPPVPGLSKAGSSLNLEIYHRVDHIARHDLQLEEVEEVCFGQALVQRAKSYGRNPVYYVLGQISSGRHLFSVDSRLW